MKSTLLSLLVSIIAFSANSQLLNHANIEGVFRDFMIQAHSQRNQAVMNDFAGVGGKDRFFAAKWMGGGATNNFEATISTGYLFNYDFLTQELFAKWADTVIIVNNNYVRRFFLLDGGKPHFFVKSSVLNAKGDIFYESIAFDEASSDSGKVQLLKLRSVKRLKANKDSYLSNFNGDYDEKYDEKIEYFLVYPDQTSEKIKFNKASLSEALSKKYATKVDEFFKVQSKSMNEEVAAALIRYINK